MICSLYIENFVLLQSERLFFSGGLNVITGESGAGKTIILEAISFLLGAVSGKGYLSPDSDECYVEALFEPSDEVLEEIHRIPFLDKIEKSIIICRRYRRNGRSDYFLDNHQITLELLSKIRPFLLETCFRDEAYEAYTPRNTILMLNTGCSNDLIAEVSGSFSVYHRIRAEFEKSVSLKNEREIRLEIIDRKILEIETSGLLSCDETELENEFRYLANFEELTSTLNDAVRLISDSEICQRISEKLKRLTRMGNLPGKASEIIELLTQSGQNLSLFVDLSEGFLSNASFDSRRLSDLTELMKKLADFQKKYGTGIPEIRETLNNLKTEKQELVHLLDLKLGREELDRAEACFMKAASELSSERKLRAAEVEKQIGNHLKDLNLKESRLLFSFQESLPCQDGIDRIEILFSANPGIPPQPLTKVASFGEHSRLLLSLKLTFGNALAGTVAFDEIEAGLGGKTLDAAVEKLNNLSEKQQILAVTHSSRLAKLAKTHFIVEKTVSENKTSLKIIQAGATARKKELSRMAQ